MKLTLAVVLLLTVPVVLAPVAAAWPPVCIEREVGEPGSKVYAHAWANCGVGAEAGVCPKDGFCTEL